MTTSFSALPIIDISILSSATEENGPTASPTDPALLALSQRLYDVFSTTGFAYLVNAPLSFSHDEIFSLAREFFALPGEQKLKLAKKSFVRGNVNTYRGYFPTQPLTASDNLKEGFEIGSPLAIPGTPPSPSRQSKSKFNLSESNVWPEEGVFPSRQRLEDMYDELQSLASRLLSLLAISLGKPSDYFASWLDDSLSTLRLLHYPSLPKSQPDPRDGRNDEVKLSCTPHTDSGILTLLHQDATGGLEVLNAAGVWVPAPYVPGSIVVNIGDLMARVSGGRFTATMHRVRAPPPRSHKLGDRTEKGNGRFSIPFFFEPGEKCVIQTVDEHGEEEMVLYGEYVRQKMSTFVEYQEDSGYDTAGTEG